MCVKPWLMLCKVFFFFLLPISQYDQVRYVLFILQWKTSSTTLYRQTDKYEQTVYNNVVQFMFLCTTFSSLL